MPTYRLTVQANCTTTGHERSFHLRVDAPTAADARKSIGNRPVVDPLDGAWFDEWSITDTRKV